MASINSTECTTCKNGLLDDSNKARIKVYCKLKDKTYYYGQYIQCDNKEKKKDGNN